MAITLYHDGRTPGQTQYGLDTFTEHYKSPDAADAILTDTSGDVPVKGDAHPDYVHMYVIDRYCNETGERAASLDVVYTGCLRDDGGGNPVLPPQKESSGSQQSSATTNTDADIFPATVTNPASVTYHAITNTLTFISNDPGDASVPSDPPEVDSLISWDLGAGLQPGFSFPALVTYLLTSAFVQQIVQPPAEVEPIVNGQFYQIVKKKTQTLFPYAPPS
jgi:hypothetical protein